MTQRISLREAAAIVQDGSTLALGGMTLYRRPVAFVRELLRRDPHPHNLTLLAFTAGYAADLLVGAGTVTTVRSAYFGLEVFGLAPMFTHMANQGALTIREETEASLVMGLRAAVNGVGYLPSTAWQGTDLLHLRPDVKSVPDPYTGEQHTAFPAIPVDVAVIHALEADAMGNVAINNNLAIDQLLVYAANTVIVTAERAVERIEPAPHKTVIPFPGIDVVAIAPKGAYPTSCYPLYPLDGHAFLHYTDTCTTPNAFSAYLAAWLDADAAPRYDE